MSTQTEMMELYPHEVGQLLDFCFESKRNLFIWGAPGIGKTQITRQLAEKKGVGYTPLHLTLMEPIDLNC